MIVGQEYYRRYVKRGHVEYLESYIIEIKDGIAYLANGKKFECGTGLECNTDESYIWEPITSETKAFIRRRQTANKARKWFKKILELDNIVLDLYRRLNTNSDIRRCYNYLTQEERESLKTQTVSYIKKNYRQPYWCGHQNAFEGVFGCEKLIKGEVVSPGKCLLCPCYVQSRTYDVWRRLRTLASIPTAKINQYLQIYDYEDIEMGNREPTEKEMTLLKHLFGMDQWTIEECQFFLNTIDSYEKKRDDPMFKKWGDTVKYKVNLNSIFYENTEIKRW